MTKVPCKLCEIRHENCHATCEDYLKYKLLREEARLASFEQKNTYPTAKKIHDTNHILRTHKYRHNARKVTT